MSEITQNIANEILFVGSIYKKPDLLIEYGAYVRSEYDFSDETAQFFYDNAVIMYYNHTQTFNKTTLSTFFAENTERLNQFKKYGGLKLLKQWMDLAVVEDFEKTFEVLKKYSLLREYEKQGYNVEKIVNYPKFEMMTAADIYKAVRGMVDRVHTVILTNNEGVVLNNDMTGMVDQCLVTPDMGIYMPFPILNDSFRGIKLSTMMCVGMLSNSGKSRFMFRLLANLALVKKQKVGILLNEMNVAQMKRCLLISVINNDEFKALHGIDVTKKEKEFALGLYHDNHGELIYRERDDWGDYTESVEEYQHRLEVESEEYNKVKAVAKWIEEQTEGLIYANDISSCYDDKSLEYEIRKMNLIHGVKYVFYDTLKSDVKLTGEWAALKATTTMLSQLTRELNIFLYGSIQLTDETNYIKPHELNSSSIANAKQLKHVLDSLLLFKEIAPHEKSKYQYLQHNPDFGSPVPCDLDENKRYYACVVDKNRDGDKKKLVFEVNLNLNTWTELGELLIKRTARSD